MTAGAIGGAMLGSYAGHRRGSFLGTLVGAIIPAAVGTIQWISIDRSSGEPPARDYAVAYGAMVLVPVGAIVGNALVGR